MPKAKQSEMDDEARLGVIIPSFRVSEQLSEDIKTDLNRRRNKDPNVPDQYNFRDHLRFLLKRGIETAEY